MKKSSPIDSGRRSSKTHNIFLDNASQDQNEPLLAYKPICISSEGLNLLETERSHTTDQANGESPIAKTPCSSSETVGDGDGKGDGIPIVGNPWDSLCGTVSSSVHGNDIPMTTIKGYDSGNSSMSLDGDSVGRRTRSSSSGSKQEPDIDVMEQGNELLLQKGFNLQDDTSLPQTQGVICSDYLNCTNETLRKDECRGDFNESVLKLNSCSISHTPECVSSIPCGRISPAHTGVVLDAKAVYDQECVIDGTKVNPISAVSASPYHFYPLSLKSHEFSQPIDDHENNSKIYCHQNTDYNDLEAASLYFERERIMTLTDVPDGNLSSSMSPPSTPTPFHSQDSLPSPSSSQSTFIEMPQNHPHNSKLGDTQRETDSFIITSSAPSCSKLNPSHEAISCSLPTACRSHDQNIPVHDIVKDSHKVPTPSSASSSPQSGFPFHESNMSPPTTNKAAWIPVISTAAWSVRNAPNSYETYCHMGHPSNCYVPHQINPHQNHQSLPDKNPPELNHSKSHPNHNLHYLPHNYPTSYASIFHPQFTPANAEVPTNHNDPQFPHGNVQCPSNHNDELQGKLNERNGNAAYVRLPPPNHVVMVPVHREDQPPPTDLNSCFVSDTDRLYLPQQCGFNQHTQQYRFNLPENSNLQPHIVFSTNPGNPALEGRVNDQGPMVPPRYNILYLNVPLDYNSCNYITPNNPSFQNMAMADDSKSQSESLPTQFQHSNSTSTTADIHTTPAERSTILSSTNWVQHGNMPSLSAMPLYLPPSVSAIQCAPTNTTSTMRAQLTTTCQYNQSLKNNGVMTSEQRSVTPTIQIDQHNDDITRITSNAIPADCNSRESAASLCDWGGLDPNQTSSQQCSQEFIQNIAGFDYKSGMSISNLRPYDRTTDNSNLLGHHHNKGYCPDYKWLCIISSVINPLVGPFSVMTNTYAKKYHSRGLINTATNLYYITFLISCIAIFTTITGILIGIAHASVPSERGTVRYLSSDQTSCLSSHIGENYTLIIFYNISIELYCQVIEHETLTDAMKRFHLQSYDEMKMTEYDKRSSEENRKAFGDKAKSECDTNAKSTSRFEDHSDILRGSSVIGSLKSKAVNNSLSTTPAPINITASLLLGDGMNNSSATDILTSQTDNDGNSSLPLPPGV